MDLKSIHKFFNPNKLSGFIIMYLKFLPKSLYPNTTLRYLHICYPVPYYISLLLLTYKVIEFYKKIKKTHMKRLKYLFFYCQCPSSIIRLNKIRIGKKIIYAWTYIMKKTHSRKPIL